MKALHLLSAWQSEQHPPTEADFTVLMSDPVPMTTSLTVWHVPAGANGKAQAELASKRERSEIRVDAMLTQILIRVTGSN